MVEQYCDPRALASVEQMAAKSMTDLSCLPFLASALRTAFTSAGQNLSVIGQRVHADHAANSGVPDAVVSGQIIEFRNGAAAVSCTVNETTANCRQRR